MKLLLLISKVPAFEERFSTGLLQTLLAFLVLSKKNTLIEATINIISKRRVGLGFINSVLL